MPLIKSSTEKSFNKNLLSELAAGKPKEQAIAIAYSVKDKAKISDLSRNKTDYSK